MTDSDPKEPPDEKPHALSYIMRSVLPARPYYAAPKPTGRPAKPGKPSAENMASQKRLASLFHRYVRLPSNAPAGGAGKRAAVIKSHVPIIALIAKFEARNAYRSVRALALDIQHDLLRPRTSNEKRPPAPSLSTIERIIRAHAVSRGGID